MALPSYVNSGAHATPAFDNDVTPALPASLVNGNLLIGVVSSSANSATFTWPADWSVIDFHSTSGGRASSVAYRFVDGTEVAPNIVASGSASLEAQVHQLTGTLPDADFLGVFTKSSQNSSGVSTWTHTGITTLTADALVGVFFHGDSTVGNVADPDGYDPNAETATTTFLGFWSQDKATAGAADSISETVGLNSRWVSWMIEIRSQGTEVTGTGALDADAAAAEGDGLSLSTGTGALAAGASTVDGQSGVEGTGALASGASAAEGDGLSGSSGDGEIVSAPATVDGFGGRVLEIVPPSIPAVVVVVVNR